ncbi:M81 family metallopeptidase [Paenibacillus eucommiae]|uniref:Microcystin degradation protein MlrC n=1 Tax=Paenibacillus eucommiae TaxID=1355755 RepID=A0ABS4IPG1_9BACL|nr:M81 family metallopeptidase [Paenibacillus eucommiae]MBP1988514.1 microcystin degradation protein MlrC [Paenibacillus eucommiae]
MRIGIIGLVHETNTFAPGRTELCHFQDEWIVGNAPFIKRYEHTRTFMGGVLSAAAKLDVEIAVGLYAAATPSGMVTRDSMDSIIEHLVDSIPDPIDGLVVMLHGAIVSENFDDVEGQLLRRIREKAGSNLPVAITLDLHANISPQMVQLADILVGQDTYPHVDSYERAIEAIYLLYRCMHSEIRPTRSYRHARILVAPQAMVTDKGFMKEIIEAAFEIEKDVRVLNVTVAGGFPFSDVVDAGMSFVVTTENDLSLAESYAEQLCQLVWDRRGEFEVTGFTAEESVALGVQSAVAPVILIEGSDNVGGGSPGDATFLLKHLVDAPAKSLIVIHDKEAVTEACRLGVGALFQGLIGGKTDTFHGPPVWISGEVRVLFDGKYRHIGPYMTGHSADMGPSAVIETDTVTVVLTGKRVGPWDVGHITSVGLQPNDFKLIVVKSAVAWQTAFGPLAKAIIQVDTPGCCGFNLHELPYEHIQRPIYPLDDFE